MAYVRWWLPAEIDSTRKALYESHKQAGRTLTCMATIWRRSSDLHEVAARLEWAELELLALKVRSLTLLETSLDGVILVDN